MKLFDDGSVRTVVLGIMGIGMLLAIAGCTPKTKFFIFAPVPVYDLDGGTSTEYVPVPVAMLEGPGGSKTKFREDGSLESVDMDNRGDSLFDTLNKAGAARLVMPED